MRRMGVLVGVWACLVLPASALAEVPGFTQVGPAATLNQIVFAADGTIYGSVSRNADIPSEDPGVLWRSTDHGHTWKAAYQLPFGWQVIPSQVSPADSSVVFASVTPPHVANGGSGELERIDVRTGLAVPLSLGQWLGVDAAGTAYGSAPGKDGGWNIVRCRMRADACDSVPFPSFQTPPYLSPVIVDPDDTGVLVAFDRRVLSPTGWILEVSDDGGGTWAPGAPVACCALEFAGPGARTLYVRADAALAISQNAGMTWGPAVAVPTTPIIVGSRRPAVFFGTPTNPLTMVTDDGTPVRTVNLPIWGSVIVDPTDANRMFVVRGDETRFSEDGGQTWRDVADARFGVASSPYTPAYAGAGSYLYVSGQDSIWYSHDRGATWGRAERPQGESTSSIVASRDDPRVAYATTSQGTAAGAIRTLDGGVTWQAIAGPVSWIEPGDPLRVFAIGNIVEESVDGGMTWTQPPQTDWCIFETMADTTSPTGQRLRCNGWWSAGDPLRPLPSPVPFAPGLSASPDLPGTYAIALPKGLATVNHQILLGDLSGDWSWNSLLGATGAFGPSASGDAVAAWPAAGGTTFYAWDPLTSTTWVRRGTDRWWRLRVAGRDVSVLATLDATHALVGTKASFGLTGVIDLAHPALAAPLVQPAGSELTCRVPWSADDAVTTAYAWLRDGVPIAGATAADYANGDRTHTLACRVTATTDFGSSTVTSEPYPSVRFASAPLGLTGVARPGHSLRCGAAVRLTWFRDGRAMKGRHARTLALRARDRGHTIACQTRSAAGLLSRSRSVRVGT